MKYKDIEKLSDVSKLEKLKELKRGLLNMRFKKATGQEIDPSLFKKTRRDIARLLTVGNVSKTGEQDA